MKLLPPKFEAQYDSDEAEWANNDLFQRGQFAKSLTNLVVQVEEPLVMGLYAKWGEGKSTFVEMWKRQLEQINHVPTIYIDAFENDYFEDPFVCLTGEVYAYAEEHIGTETEMIQSIAETGGKVGKIIAKSLGNIALRAATAGVVNTDDFGDVSSAFSDSLDELLNQEISTYSAQKDALKSFRDKLSEVADKLGDGERPLVIIVDELDRCKPTFALEMLERIKHLFAVENVVFVLVLNPEQMGCVIKRVYGDNVDATDYLHKFIDMPIHLPISEKRPSKSDFADMIFNKLNVFGDHHYTRIASLFCQSHNLSLREIERIASLVNGSRIASCGTENYDHFLAFFLAFLKVRHPKLFEKSGQRNNIINEIEKLIPTLPEKNHAMEIFRTSHLRLFGDYEDVNEIERREQQDPIARKLSWLLIDNKEYLQMHINWVNMFGLPERTE